MNLLLRPLCCFIFTFYEKETYILFLFENDSYPYPLLMTFHNMYLCAYIVSLAHSEMDVRIVFCMGSQNIKCGHMKNDVRRPMDMISTLVVLRPYLL